MSPISAQRDEAVAERGAAFTHVRESLRQCVRGEVSRYAGVLAGMRLLERPEEVGLGALVVQEFNDLFESLATVSWGHWIGGWGECWLQVVAGEKKQPICMLGSLEES